MRYNLRNGALGYVIIAEELVFCLLLRAREARHRRGPIQFNHRETPVISDFRKVVAMGKPVLQGWS